MIERYTLPRMNSIWTVEHKLEVWLRIESLVCEALAGQGEIPKTVAPIILEKVKINVKRMREIEELVKHDVIAFLEMVSEQMGPSSRYLHLGLTSSDVLDTALAVLMVEASDIIIEDLDRLLQVLKRRAMEFKETVMVGRSHGIHGEPITFGFKLALWFSEMERNLNRVRSSRKEIGFGKLSGAMGTFAHLSPTVEAFVCEKLDLRPAPISSQIIQRDRHAQYLATLAVLAGSIDKVATEIRHLQRTEVSEVEESFSKGQKGSSAMPHKRNPVGSENLSGLARVVRSNAMAGLDNIPLWHERDISHSSVERIIIPDSTGLIDYMLNRLTGIIDHLVVYPEHMKGNLEKSEGLLFSQRVLLELAKRGVSREKAYQAVQKQAMAAWDGEGSFKELLKKDSLIGQYMKPVEIDNCFEVGYYMKHLETLYKRTFG